MIRWIIDWIGKLVGSIFFGIFLLFSYVDDFFQFLSRKFSLWSQRSIGRDNLFWARLLLGIGLVLQTYVLAKLAINQADSNDLMFEALLSIFLLGGLLVSKMPVNNRMSCKLYRISIIGFFIGFSSIYQSPPYNTLVAFKISKLILAFLSLHLITCFALPSQRKSEEELVETKKAEGVSG